MRVHPRGPGQVAVLALAELQLVLGRAVVEARPALEREVAGPAHGTHSPYAKPGGLARGGRPAPSAPAGVTPAPGRAARQPCQALFASVPVIGTELGAPGAPVGLSAAVGAQALDAVHGLFDEVFPRLKGR